MTAASSERYDVVVAGGGPAGATVATLLADAGHRVLLVERAARPQFKLGESLMPATYWVLERLGVLDRMRSSHFPKKYSVQFVSASGRSSQPFYFSENDPHESSQTWQVLREEFDQLLLDNAAEKGVEVRRGVSVKRALFDGERAVGARLQHLGEPPVEVACRVLVDATGQSTLLARHLKLRRLDPAFRNASFYTHFEGARRDRGIDEGATIIYQTEGKRSWFWFIPLPNDRVSVGVVGPVSHLIEDRAADPRQTFEEELDRCPALAERLVEARRVMPIQAIRDYSYHASPLAGPGWLLVGDAAGFIDPIYSTGVFLALKSGEMAADAILGGLASDDLSGATLGAFAPRLEEGMAALRTLVLAFYEPDFSFGRFLEQHPECRADLINMLVGNVFTHPVEHLVTTLDEALPGLARRPRAVAP